MKSITVWEESKRGEFYEAVHPNTNRQCRQFWFYLHRILGFGCHPKADGAHSVWKVHLKNSTAACLPQIVSRYITFILQILLSKATCNKCIQTWQEQELDVIKNWKCIHLKQTTKSMFIAAVCLFAFKGRSQDAAWEGECSACSRGRAALSWPGVCGQFIRPLWKTDGHYLFLWKIHTPLCRLFALEIFSTKEIVTVKTVQQAHRFWKEIRLSF